MASPVWNYERRLALDLDQVFVHGQGLIHRDNSWAVSIVVVDIAIERSKVVSTCSVQSGIIFRLDSYRTYQPMAYLYLVVA